MSQIVTLSTQDNAKLWQQLKSSFGRATNWNKYQSKVTIQKRNWYLDYLIDPSFQGVNKLFGMTQVKQEHLLPDLQVED